MSPGEATTQQGYVSEEALEVLEEAPKVLEGAPRVLEEDPRVLEEAPRVLEEGSLTLIHIRGQVAGTIFQVFTSAVVATIPSNSFQSSIFDRLFVSNPVSQKTAFHLTKIINKIGSRGTQLSLPKH